MKLKNKKTGEVKECVVIPIDSNGYPNEYEVFEKGDSLAELNEDWEDYKPKEPLIKDAKIRKAVRAWAEAVGGASVCFYDDTDGEGVGRLKIYREGYPAVFDLGHRFYDLELCTQYDIDELCGEEEE